MANVQPPIVLLAEDDRDLVFLIRRAVENANLTISLQIVFDGQQAINYLSGVGEYADRSRYPLPQLILSNVRMPYVNGIELLTWIKQQPEFAILPVVMMSNIQSPTDVNQITNLGASAFLVKPASREGLVEFVLQVMSFLPTPEA